MTMHKKKRIYNQIRVIHLWKTGLLVPPDYEKETHRAMKNRVILYNYQIVLDALLSLTRCCDFEVWHRNHSCITGTFGHQIQLTKQSHRKIECMCTNTAYAISAIVAFVCTYKQTNRSRTVCFCVFSSSGFHRFSHLIFVVMNSRKWNETWSRKLINVVTIGSVLLINANCTLLQGSANNSFSQSAVDAAGSRMLALEDFRTLPFFCLYWYD